MITFTNTQIESAARTMKILALAGAGLDNVAILLNCDPNDVEIQHAKEWARALELSTRDIRSSIAAALIRGGKA